MTTTADANREKRILVLDDDPLACGVIARVLSETGAEIICEHDGQRGRQLLEGETQFDLVVVDLIVPHVSGWDILEILKPKDQGGPRCVIVMTACDISSEEKAKLLEQVHAVVDKRSFTLAGFRAIVESCWGR